MLDDDALDAAKALSGLAIREEDDGDERIMRRVVLPGRSTPAWVDADALAVVATYLMLRSAAATDAGLSGPSQDMAFGTFALLYPAHRRWIPRVIWPAVAPQTAADPLDDIEDLITEGGPDVLGQAIARLDAPDTGDTVTGDTERRRFLRGLALRDRAMLPDRTPAERLADIDTAIDILTSCSAAPEPHATWRALGQIALAEAWEKRFVIAGRSADLAAAESGYRQALADAPEETDIYADAAGALGFTLARRGVASPEPEGPEGAEGAALAEAARWLRVAVDCSYTMEGRLRHRDLLAAVMGLRLEAMPHVRTFPGAREEPAKDHPEPRPQAEAVAEARTTVTGLHGEPDGPELLAAARAAFDLLDPVRDPLGQVFLLRVLVRFGEVLLPGDLEDLLPVSLAAVRDRDGPREAAALLGAALTLTQEATRPDLTRQLIESADRDLPNLPAETDRRTRWSAEVHVLAENRIGCPPGPFDAKAALSALREQMLEEDWPAEARAATLVHVAAELLGTGNEELGRDLVTETQGLAPGLWQLHAPALYYLRGMLTVNAAADLEDAGHPDLAARHLADAVGTSPNAGRRTSPTSPSAACPTGLTQMPGRIAPMLVEDQRRPDGVLADQFGDLGEVARACAS